MNALWFSEWISAVRAEAQKAILRQVAAKEAFENIANYWEDLKSSIRILNTTGLSSLYEQEMDGAASELASDPQPAGHTF